MDELGLTSADVAYNLESSYQLIQGSKTGRDNYAFIDPTYNDGVKDGLRYNLAFKNYLADEGIYGDGGFSLIINPGQYTVLDDGDVNNYCYGVFEGAINVGQFNVNFYNEGRINTRIDTSTFYGSYEQTDSGILQIALQDDSEGGINSGQFDFHGEVTFSDTTNLRVSVRDNLTTDELDGVTISNVAVDQNGGNELAWTNTNFVAQDNRLAVNFTPQINFVDSSVELVAYDTGLTTLEAAALRPTKDLGWLLDDYNLLQDADFQTRELNAYLYQLGSSDNRFEVNAQLHKALPLLAGGNTLSNINLLNDTRDNISDRLVSRLDQKVGDVYMGKKNAWFRAFGNDATQSRRDDTAGYDSKALGGTFGIDNMVGESLIGAAFTYARNDVDGSSHFNGQEGKTRSYDLTLYGSTPLSADKKTFINYQVGGGIMDTSTRRQFYDLNCCNDVVASGQYDTSFARANINLNHRLDLSNKTSFTPAIGLSYVYMDEDSYTERGAGDLKLHVDSVKTEQALASLGGRFDFYPGEGVRMYLGATGYYDMVNDQVDLDANFVNLVDSGFRTKGIDQSPWITKASAGVSINVNSVELNAGYSYTDRSDFENHMATLRALYSF
jgi:outer membrane autotransporter protein